MMRGIKLPVNIRGNKHSRYAFMSGVGVGVAVGVTVGVGVPVGVGVGVPVGVGVGVTVPLGEMGTV